MNPILFALPMGAALLLGATIGLERQWRRRTTGLRTNAMVAVGAAIFVTMDGLNTAATLWCTAAVGTLIALGQIGLAAVGTAAVLASNLLLRPVAQRASWAAGGSLERRKRA
jgi:putative Mg2+ transporter-C (MgtC) family protein